MRRRLLVTLLAVVTAGLVFAGLGTFLIARGNAGDQAETLAVQRATALSAATMRPGLGHPGEMPGFSRDRVAMMSRSLGVRDIGVLAVALEDVARTRVIAPLPAGLTVDDLDIDRLIATGSDSGRTDDGAFGVAFSRVGTDEVGMAFVVSTDYSTNLGRAGGWFVLASIGTLLLAVGASSWLSRSLSRPVVDAAGAARRIADGDLSVRLPSPNRRRTDELTDLTAAINSMAEGLERSRGLERQFLLSVSHDLRTPLTSIIGYAEALTDGTTDDAAAAGRIIRSEADRLNRLVRDLLDLARLDAHRFELDLRAADLNEATRRAVVAFATVSDGVELDVSTPDEPVVAMIDTDRWSQMVANLLENGIRHARSRLSVSITVETDRAVLRIEDDGKGIDEADLPHVFERLFTARPEGKAAATGSGLGLAIVRELVQAMGGRVDAISPPGTGATIIVSVPLA
ncbi:MAG: HAMP domain-containing histidine kinase [Actinobacteria bacterium]|nr:HAMP domain-containing histidine kinase [Actinomycetota bacterium]